MARDARTPPPACEQQRCHASRIRCGGDQQDGHLLPVPVSRRRAPKLVARLVAARPQPRINKPAWRGFSTHQPLFVSMKSGSELPQPDAFAGNGSLPSEPVEALVELEKLCDRVRLGVRNLDVGDLPVGERRLDLFGLAPAAGGGGGAAQSDSTVASAAATAPTSRPIAGRCSGLKPWKVPVSSTSRNPVPTSVARRLVTSPCTRRTSLAVLRCGRGRAPAVFREVDAGDLPAPLGQLEAPDGAATPMSSARPYGGCVRSLHARTAR